MERDFPIDHPAASDYDGTPYHPPRAPYGEDFPEGHPARGGKNITPLDTPDGRRAAALEYCNDLVDLAVSGSLPPLVDDVRHDVIDLPPVQLATLYALRNGLLPPSDMADVEQTLIGALVHRGLSEARAKSVIDGYCVPVTQK